MSFVEVDLFGVYVAPVAVLVVVAYAVFWIGRWVAGRLGLRFRVWHPALFAVAVYLIILSCLVLAAASLGPHV